MFIKLLRFSVLNILLLVGCLSISYAQPIEVIADYPLISDLSDNTGNNTDVFLEGNPTLPTPPSAGSPLCSNGIYIIAPDGQNIQTPIMPTFDIRNFQMEVEFNVTQLPSDNGAFSRMPIIMGSRNARWLGIYLDVNGFMGFKYNNDFSNYVWSNTAMAGVGVWNSARIRYNFGQVDLYLNNQLILSQNVGPLNTFQNTFNFMVTDFSNGFTFNGCVRNLIISSSPLVIFKNGFE